MNYQKEISSILRCPTCHGSLLPNNAFSLINCKNCAVDFPIVDNIIVLLMREELQKFLKEPWGKKLVEEKFGIFVNSENEIQKLEAIVKHAKSHKPKESFSSDTTMLKELKAAIDQSREILAKKSHVNSAQKILDWPTGPGFFLKYLVDIISKDALIVAADINFGQLATTKAHLDRLNKTNNILFIVCDVRNMPFQDNIFHSVTAWGGTIEVPDANIAVKESHRVLEKNGWFGISGDLYENNSESLNIAKKLGFDSLATEERLQKAFKKLEFVNFSYETIYEGIDTDFETPLEERAPLPAPGDKFRIIVASGQKE